MQNVLNSVENIVLSSNKRAAESITNSVIKYLNENHLASQKKKQNSKQRKAITSSYILTEDQVRNELMKELAEKTKKKKELDERKAVRLTKRAEKLESSKLAKQKREEKAKNKVRSSKIDLATKFVYESKDQSERATSSYNCQLEAFVDLKDRQCAICLILFNIDLNKQSWRNCEGRACDIWYCASCNSIYPLNQEFYCNICEIER